jgi:hypothetical protein
MLSKCSRGSIPRLPCFVGVEAISIREADRRGSEFVVHTDRVFASSFHRTSRSSDV